MSDWVHPGRLVPRSRSQASRLAAARMLSWWSFIVRSSRIPRYRVRPMAAEERQAINLNLQVHGHVIAVVGAADHRAGGPAHVASADRLVHLAPAGHAGFG